MINKQSIFLISFAPALGGLLFGYDTAVISGTLGQVRNAFNLSPAYEGWFVSCGLLGCMIGVVVAGILSNLIGRKTVLLLAGVTFLLSAIGCSVAPDKEILVISRLIGGIGVGIASVVSPLYISEFAPAAKRGMLVATYQLAITIGIFLAYMVNAAIAYISPAVSGANFLSALFAGDQSWRGMFLMMGIPAVLFMFVLAFIPESIRYLMQKGKQAAARQILFKTRDEQSATAEWEKLLLNETANKTPISYSTLKKIRWPLFVGILLAFFQQFSGINAVIYYGPEIFKKAGIPAENALVFQSIVGAVNVMFTFIAIRKSDKSGRRPLLLWGLSGLIISLFLIGLIFNSQQVPGYFILICTLSFIACFALSLGPVTWILINEIFPAALRVPGVTICTFAVWIAVGLLGQFFPVMLEVLGAANTFWLFGLSCLAHLLFTYKYIPETKGKALEDTEKLFIAH